MQSMKFLKNKRKGFGTYPDKRRAGFLSEKMKNSELKEYVNSFPDDASVSVILANPRKRKLYSVENILVVADQAQPIFCIDVGEETNMDAEFVAACEECERDADDLEGQMQIEDFPEVMPRLLKKD